MPAKDPLLHEDERTVTRERRKTKRPRLWKVIIHNDDYTTMDFVVEVLMKHFNKSVAEATQVMLQVHHKGSGIAGVYTRDIAESKVAHVTEEAKNNGHPLSLSAEPE
jgi:ATP-dependent Clp protease adaptor protein ClpS